MDVVGGVIARLDGRAPRWADRLRWRRERHHDAALRAVDLLVSRGDVVIDVGASEGHFTSRLLDIVGRGGVVYSFEPNPERQARLRALQGRDELRLHQVALSDAAGRAELRIPIVNGKRYTGWASLEERPDYATDVVDVPVARLDDVVAAEQTVRFIKCDVEGHEDAVFGGAPRVLERDRPSVLVEIEQRHRNTEVARAFELFAALGYEAWAVFPTGLRPLSEFELERDQLSFLTRPTTSEIMPRGYVHNFLFVRAGTDLGKLTSR